MLTPTFLKFTHKSYAHELVICPCCVWLKDLILTLKPPYLIWNLVALTMKPLLRLLSVHYAVYIISLFEVNKTLWMKFSVYRNLSIRLCCIRRLFPCAYKYRFCISFFSWFFHCLMFAVFQIVSEDILQELENMDKECDIDDILNYRTIAEQQLQVVDDSIRRMLRVIVNYISFSLIMLKMSIPKHFYHSNWIYVYLHPYITSMIHDWYSTCPGQYLFKMVCWCLNFC